MPSRIHSSTGKEFGETMKTGWRLSEEARERASGGLQSVASHSPSVKRQSLMCLLRVSQSDLVADCNALSYVPSKMNVEVLSPIPCCVALFENRIISDVTVKMIWYWSRVVLWSNITVVLIRRGPTEDTDTKGRGHVKTQAETEWCCHQPRITWKDHQKPTDLRNCLPLEASERV